MDYTSIATIDSSSSPTLTAVSTGTATLTATVGSVTANATVTVLSGTSLPAGTAIWSSPTPSGFTVVQTVQAVPTSTGPALYSVMADSSYANTVVTALTSDGQKLWTSATLSGFPYMAYADGNGGALVYVGGQLVDLDEQTGTQIWQSDFLGDVAAAIGADGKIYLDASVNSNVSLITHDGNTGALVNSYALPLNTLNVAGATNLAWVLNPTAFSAPIVGPDGNSYSLVQTNSFNAQFDGSVYSLSSFQIALSLLEMTPDGSTTLTPIHTNSALVSGASELNCFAPNQDPYIDGGNSAACIYNGNVEFYTQGYFPLLSAGSVIPDGAGGFLLSWGGMDDGSTAGVQFHVTHLTSDGQSDFVLPFSPWEPVTMVLGDQGSGMAYATGIYQNHALAFHISDGSTGWSYTAPSSSDVLGVVAAIDGGGLIITDDDGSALALVTLDATGTATTSGLTADSGASIDPLPNLNHWLRTSNYSLATLIGPTDGLAYGPFPLPQGNLQEQSAPPSCQTSTSTCAVVPIGDIHSPNGGYPQREITYGVFSLRSGNLTRSLHHEVGFREESLSGPTAYCLTGNPHTTCDGTDSVVDALAAQLTTGSTVRQKFFVDRTQVKAFWPYPVTVTGGFQQTQWFGALTQQATTNNSYTSGAHITQESPDSSGVLCGSGCSKIETDGTTVLP